MSNETDSQQTSSASPDQDHLQPTIEVEESLDEALLAEIENRRSLVPPQVSEVTGQSTAQPQSASQPPVEDVDISVEEGNSLDQELIDYLYGQSHSESSAVGASATVTPDQSYPPTETPTQVERNKDLTSLQDTIRFFELDYDRFDRGMLNLGRRGGPAGNLNFVKGLNFQGFNGDNDRSLPPEIPHQLSVEHIHQILFSLPPELVKLSKLSTIAWVPQIRVPNFDRNGHFTGKAEWTTNGEFLDGQRNPDRVLLGQSLIVRDKGKNGQEELRVKMKLTAIPSVITEDTGAVMACQVYSLLREFMHSVLDPVIMNKQEEQVMVGESKNLRQWMDELLQSVLSGKEPVLTSDYSEMYGHMLHSGDSIERKIALKELVCDTFAAYILNIMPNRKGYTSFNKADFGNAEFRNGTFERSGMVTDRYRLINELCTSPLQIVPKEK